VTRIVSGVGIGGEFGLAFAMLFAEVWKTERRGVMGRAIQSMFIVGEILTQAVAVRDPVHPWRRRGLAGRLRDPRLR
jgi:uncharacterized membrane protein